MPRLFESTAIALTASGVKTEELTEQVERSAAALPQREHDVLKEQRPATQHRVAEGGECLYARAGRPASLRTVHTLTALRLCIASAPAGPPLSHKRIAINP
jgi:hypothetical protein